MKALINVKIYDYVNLLEPGYILFDEDIYEVGSMESFPKDQSFEAVIDGQGRLLLPGLINFHTHMYSAFARGFDFQRNPNSFTETLEDIWWRMDGALTQEDCYWSAIAHGRDLIRKGVVGLLDHHASGQIRGSTKAVEEAMQEIGLHGLTCFEISDRFDVETSIQENMEMVERTGGPVGLHASMTLSSQTLASIKKSIGDHPIHIHVSESIDDQIHFLRTPVERLSMAEVLNPGSVLAHCVHITEADAKTIADHKGIVALNPRSNQNNGVGTFDYALFHRHKLPIVVGTDGLGADIAKSWQTVYYLAKADPASRNLMSLTDIQDHIVKSYKIYQELTGLSLGRFQSGYRFDAILIDYDQFTPMDENNAFGHVFFGVFDDLRIRSLWNGGQLLLDQYELLHSSEVPESVVRSLWKRIEVAK